MSLTPYQTKCVKSTTLPRIPIRLEGSLHANTSISFKRYHESTQKQLFRTKCLEDSRTAIQARIVGDEFGGCCKASSSSVSDRVAPIPELVCALSVALSACAVA
eukprot:1184749-Prorocentrum_minimum.AAC.2